jgi:hypothetical protein
MKLKRVVVLLATLPVSPVFAADCLSMIRSSRLTAVSVLDSSEVRAAASQFCSAEGRRERRRGSFSLDFFVDKLPLGLNIGTSGEKQLSSKYCSSGDSLSASSLAYRTYVETIAPGAYDAYVQCVKLSQDEIEFELQGKIAKYLSLTVSFRPKSGPGNRALMSVTPAPGVSCKWQGQTFPRSEIELKGAAAATLSCTRESATEKHFVVLARTDGSGSTMSIPWEPFDSDGQPVYLMRELQERLSRTRDDVQRLLRKPILVSYEGSASLQNRVGYTFDFNRRLVDDEGLVTAGSDWKFTAPEDGLYSVDVVFSLPYPPEGRSNTSPYVACGINAKVTSDSQAISLANRHLFDTGCSLSSAVI